MSTDTQPSTIKAGHIGGGDEFDALAGGREVVRMLDEYVMPGQGMPAMELGAIGPDGKSYAGPVFSLC